MAIKHLLVTLLAGSILASSVTIASENESVFIPAQGKVILPHLNLGNEIYYVQLNRLNPNGFDFRLDASSVTRITPQPGDHWATRAEVTGNWVPQGLPGVALAFHVDGTYSINLPAEDNCPAGLETGTWTLDEETGVLLPRALTDANGDCGLSHPEGVARVSRDGTALVLELHDQEAGKPVVTQIRLLPQ